MMYSMMNRGLKLPNDCHYANPEHSKNPQKLWGVVSC